MKTTISVSKEQFKPGGDLIRDWFYVDAAGKTLGRLACRIAIILQGKHKPNYTRNVDMGDYVVVVNAEKIKLSGNKMKDKFYYRHTGYPGGLKTVNAETLLKRKPAELVLKAVKGMMPKNKLNRKSIRKLKVYAGAEHPHGNHKPKSFNI